MTDGAAPALSMLWEPADPTAALRTRFGFDDPAAAGRLLSDLLARRWGIVASCERIVLSAQNLLAWMRTSRRAVVVKACADPSRFDRLATIAEIVAGLGDRGLPVAPPVRTVEGRARTVVDHERPLSTVVTLASRGDLLDADDAAAVRSVGATLARTHLALASVDPRSLGPAGPRDVLATRPQLPRVASGRARAPGAARRLDELLAELPDLDVPAGLVHGDVRGANLLLDGGQVTALLDWDEMHVGHRVHDLAAAAVKLATRFRSWAPPPPGSREHLVAGYRSVAALTGAEERWLEVAVLAEGLGQIPRGPDGSGWASAVDRGL